MEKSGSWINIPDNISESLVTIFGVKNTYILSQFSDAIRIWDPMSFWSWLRDGKIRIREHWLIVQVLPLSYQIWCVPNALHATRNKVTPHKLLNTFLIASTVCRTLHFQKIEFKDQSRGVMQWALGVHARKGGGLARVRDSKRAQGTRCTQFPDFEKLRLISSGMRQSWTGYPRVLRRRWFRKLRYGAVQLCNSTAIQLLEYSSGTRIQQRYTDTAVLKVAKLFF